MINEADVAPNRWTAQREPPSFRAGRRSAPLSSSLSPRAPYRGHRVHQ